MTAAPLGDIWLDAEVARRAQTTYGLGDMNGHVIL